MTSPAVVLELSDVSKQYGALRPLRIARLTVQAGEHAALIGLDQPAAEVFISLVTGATLPDAGAVVVFGRPTASIADSTDWLATLDRFGIVSERGVLLESLTVVQNLAMPFSLEIDPVPDGIRGQAVELAREAGLPDAVFERPVMELDPASRMRIRLARALALNPSILILEHPSASISPAEAATLARDIRRIAELRDLATITLTMDRHFAAAIAPRTLTHDAATGLLRQAR